jgi:uncharacterized CHY-type Zn-finger protein
MNIHGVEVKGVGLDNETRCAHYFTPVDIIAIKFPCCNTYFPCYSCHEETADHSAAVWKKGDMDEKAILCGSCGLELTIRQYLNSGSLCPKCGHPFNPRCSSHYHLYFEL